VLDVNLVGPFLLCKAFGPTMLAQRAGSIVNVASIAGLVGVSDRSAYNASKHGLIGLTRTLAGEWGGRGVRCNAVCPAGSRPRWTTPRRPAACTATTTSSAGLPMGRFATPEDVARAIAFLADGERSGFVNGHALPSMVDGRRRELGELRRKQRG
jgi:NAD(P)-dependent dehydrogenase (short-subunit alcohol dehydrogenase family)